MDLEFCLLNLGHGPAAFLPDLSVTCLSHPDRNDIFDYVCRCARAYDDYPYPLEVFVTPDGGLHEVRLQVRGNSAAAIVERDENVFCAVHNAFRRLNLPQPSVRKNL